MLDPAPAECLFQTREIFPFQKHTCRVADGVINAYEKHHGGLSNENKVSIDKMVETAR
jgi:hypothetical protein